MRQQHEIWVVRVVLTEEQTMALAELVEGFRASGLVVIHRGQTGRLCFDILPPWDPSDTWAQDNARKMRERGFCANQAPYCPSQQPREGV